MPIPFIPLASPTTLLLQNGRIDNLVPAGDAEESHTAAPAPGTVRSYEAGDGLDLQAEWDRHAWLDEQIGLDSRR